MRKALSLTHRWPAGLVWKSTDRELKVNKGENDAPRRRQRRLLTIHVGLDRRPEGRHAHVRECRSGVRPCFTSMAPALVVESTTRVARLRDRRRERENRTTPSRCHRYREPHTQKHRVWHNLNEMYLPAEPSISSPEGGLEPRTRLWGELAPQFHDTGLILCIVDPCQLRL